MEAAWPMHRVDTGALMKEALVAARLGKQLRTLGFHHYELIGPLLLEGFDLGEGDVGHGRVSYQRV